ncbi:vegetative cell wall protein gp1 [Iris pallida]|uniref:Vegetative cell wall protein gp1 n=1 Tax=Iris pallida TaxID=29817 RepID=A0AAX6I3A3_IRIPA|nr:vegetative cell wall protein gp1 [Iris pallida]
MNHPSTVISLQTSSYPPPPTCKTRPDPYVRVFLHLIP